MKYHTHELMKIANMHLAPYFANAIAVAAPMPELLPVIITIRSFKKNIFKKLVKLFFSFLKINLKVTVTVFSSGCLQIGSGVPIIDYICNFLI